MDESKLRIFLSLSSTGTSEGSSLISFCNVTGEKTRMCIRYVRVGEIVMETIMILDISNHKKCKRMQ